RRGSSASGPKWQPGLLHSRAEGGVHIVCQEWLSSQRHEHVVVEGGIRTPLLEIPFESSLCRLVQGNEATLAEFSTANHQAIGREVVEAQPDRLRHPQSRASQQGKQSAIGRSTEGAIPRP